MKPICVPCQCFFRPLRNGTHFVEMMPKGDVELPALPGNMEPEKWQPYKVWVGDLWRCNGCGTDIIVGAPSSPISERHFSDFNERVDSVLKSMWPNLRIRVNDC